MIFKPDLFSNNIPVWNKINDREFIFFKNLCNNIPNKYISELSSVYYSGAFEINSNNFKITSKDGKSILLKKWPKGTNSKKVIKTQKLINWLNNRNIPVPFSGCFNDKNFIFQFENSIWSFNLFKDGNYYSGTKSELESAAKVTGKLASALIELPSYISPEEGPKHLSNDDDAIIHQMVLERANWFNIFGLENSNLLSFHWDYLYSTWKNLLKNDFIHGIIVPCHFDMHPHNLIAKDGKIISILDFDSCKKIPLGFSLAFNTVKQCRQFLSSHKKNNSFKFVRNFYMENLISELSFDEVNNYDFLSLAKGEIMRRICLIFKLNLIKRNSDWNHVLPIQIAHLYESDKLFEN